MRKQGVMDISELEKGELFSNMKESYIIFICMFDPFGADMPIYTVKQTFEENDKLVFDDKTHKIFYNVKAFEKLSNDIETKAFLEYLCKKQSTSKFTESLNRAVYRNRDNQLWRNDYMTLAYNMYRAAEAAAKAAAEAREKALKEGREEGISMGITQAKLETAKKLIDLGLPQDQIALVTGLSVEEIEKL